jgi:hypothetical protein
MMDSTGSVALIVGLSTAAIALLGYWNTQYLQRRDRRGTMYAEAMAVMRAYEHSPYLIRRRADSAGATRASIAARITEINVRVDHEEQLLLMDSRAVGAVYCLLSEKTRLQVRRYRDKAWQTPVICRDDQMPESTRQYTYNNKAEWDLCILAMGRELQLIGWLLRKDTLRRCAALTERSGLGKQ